MTDTGSLTGFIFARGGSKGVPGKNIRSVGGKPLIAHAIAAALGSRAIRRVVVSTDSEEIARVAREHGAETPFVRPDDLASDTAAEILAWRHAITAVRALADEAHEIDPFVSIPTTTPLRKAADIDRAVDRFRTLRANGTPADYMFGVTPSHRHPSFNMVTRDAKGWARLANMPDANAPMRRQDAAPTFDVTTAVYVADPEFVLRVDHPMKGAVATIEIPQSRALDIDSEYDLHLADLLMRSPFPDAPPGEGSA